MKAQRLSAEHGIVCHLPGEEFGYFGWPSVERLDDGKLLVASSGLRSEHMCPWGKTVLNTSTDDGATWSPPVAIHDSPLDDRDAGVVNLGGGNVIVTWASIDLRYHFFELDLREAFEKKVSVEAVGKWVEYMEELVDDETNPHEGSWLLPSSDGGETWGEKVKVPVYTPHGPIPLRNGDLLYLGKDFVIARAERDHGPVLSARSADNGRTWTEQGHVPKFPGTEKLSYAEPHVVELPSGKLVGMIRVGGDSGKVGILSFSMVQTESEDGGETWSMPRPLNFHGAPPHLIQHSSGALVMIYGYRLVGFGQRVALSYDEGASWEHDWILRDDGPDWDLGYPSTVEMADGSLFSVYYQKVPGDHRPSLLYSRWQLPG